MTVYVLAAGEYSDYHIVAVFTDRARAEKVRDALNTSEYHGGSSKCKIGEWEADVGFDEILAGLTGYEVVLSRATRNVVRTRQESAPMFGADVLDDETEDVYATHVWANDETQAIKAANERITKWLAQGKPDFRSQCDAE